MRAFSRINTLAHRAVPYKEYLFDDKIKGLLDLTWITRWNEPVYILDGAPDHYILQNIPDIPTNFPFGKRSVLGWRQVFQNQNQHLLPVDNNNNNRPYVYPHDIRVFLHWLDYWYVQLESIIRVRGHELVDPNHEDPSRSYHIIQSSGTVTNIEREYYDHDLGNKYLEIYEHAILYWIYSYGYLYSENDDINQIFEFYLNLEPINVNHPIIPGTYPAAQAVVLADDHTEGGKRNKHRKSKFKKRKHIRKINRKRTRKNKK